MVANITFTGGMTPQIIGRPRCLALAPDGATRCASFAHVCPHFGPQAQDDGSFERIEWEGGLYLDLGCGLTPAGTGSDESGLAPHVGVDLHTGTLDGSNGILAVDLFAGRLPWEDNSVDGMWCSHFVEHLPPNHMQHGVMRYPFIEFMSEVHRILKPGHSIVIIWPPVQSERAFQDPTHNWFLPPTAWLYYGREWRQRNGLDHAPYPVGVNLVISSMGSSEPHPRFAERGELALAMAQEHYWNAVPEMMVTLTKIPVDTPAAVESAAPPIVATVEHVGSPTLAASQAWAGVDPRVTGA